MHALEHERELRADLRLLVGREHVEDAVDGLDRAVRVQRGEGEVAGLGDDERRLDRLEVAHLADEHDVGILAQDVLERLLERLRCPRPTSRWFTRQFLCGCRYSIGSSIVMMCSCRSVLILSMIDASVVDLPEPVGPVTRTSPRGFFASSATIGGSPSSCEGEDLERDGAERAGHRAALHEDVRAEARRAPSRRRRGRARCPPRTCASARR